MQHTQRTIFHKSLTETIPYYYRSYNKSKILCKGEKPPFLPKNKATTKKELRHYAYVDSYINPIMRAKEFQEVLENDGISQGELAERMGVSRVRVTQILNLLKLPNELKVADEFWDFLGGKGTYQDLLDSFERVGIELRPEIDKYFRKFKK